MEHLKYLMFFVIYFAPSAFSRAGADPFAFFRPSVTITASERVRLDSGYPFARILQANGLEVAVLAAVAVSIDGDRLVAWERRVEDLKKSKYVLAIGRFSDPPRIEDLAGLALDSTDVAAIKSCRPGRCNLKLSAVEMAQLQRVASQAAGDPSVAIQQAFRKIILDRVQQYQANGYIPPYEDHGRDVQPSSRFALLLDHTQFLKDRLPELVKDLRHYPFNADNGADSFFYWSKERPARKAIVSVTHVRVVRSHNADLPDALIVGKDIFSSHYVDASLSMTALMRGDPKGKNYLVYVNRTEVDVLHGIWEGTIRHSMQSHLKNTANILRDLRQRLESGDPPRE